MVLHGCFSNLLLQHQQHQQHQQQHQQKHHQQQIAAEVQVKQMQMQRQAIANAHSTTGYPATVPPTNPSVPYTPQQLAAAAASAGLSNTNTVNPNVALQSASASNTRVYLDQTVVPLLLDGKT